MLRWIVGGLLMCGLLACTELPPLPGGDGGSAGDAGSGDDGGFGGDGGTGGIGADPCAQVALVKAVGTESDDRFQAGKATGSVCFSEPCETGVDPFDQWSIEEACVGRYTILLEWTNNDGTSNLDLVLFAENGDLLGQAVHLSGSKEEITYSLEAAEIYTIEVRAKTTGGLKRGYDVSVIRAD